MSFSSHQYDHDSRKNSLLMRVARQTGRISHPPKPCLFPTWAGCEADWAGQWQDPNLEFSLTAESTT